MNIDDYVNRSPWGCVDGTEAKRTARSDGFREENHQDFPLPLEPGSLARTEAIFLNNEGVSMLDKGRFKKASMTLKDAFALWRLADNCKRSTCLTTLSSARTSKSTTTASDERRKIEAARQRFIESNSEYDASTLVASQSVFHVEVLSTASNIASNPSFPTYEVARSQKSRDNTGQSSHNAEQDQRLVAIIEVVHPIKIVLLANLGDNFCGTAGKDFDFCAAILLFNLGVSLYCLSRLNTTDPANQQQERNQKAIKLFQLSYATLNHSITDLARKVFCDETSTDSGDQGPQEQQFRYHFRDDVLQYQAIRRLLETTVLVLQTLAQLCTTRRHISALTSEITVSVVADYENDSALRVVLQRVSRLKNAIQNLERFGHSVLRLFHTKTPAPAA